MGERVHHYRCGGEIKGADKNPKCLKCGKTGNLGELWYHEKKGMVMTFEGQKGMPISEKDIPEA